MPSTTERERILRDTISSICGHLRKAAAIGRVVYRQEGVKEGSPKATALRDLGFTLSFGSRVIPPDPEVLLECPDEDEDVIIDYADISGWADPLASPPEGPLRACCVAFAGSTAHG